jgi:nucleoside-diphosphate-sugar epimerase
MIMKRKIIIIGSTGFVGSYVTRLMRSRNDVNVYEARDIGIDLLDIRSIEKAIDTMKPDIIINLAAISDLDRYPLSKIYESNAYSIVRIIELLQDINFQGRFINTSSSLVYGVPEKNPVSENFGLKPRHHYSSAKAMIDSMFSILGNDLDVLSVRPFNCFGCGQPDRYVVPKLITHFKNKKKFIELGSIDNKRDFVDIRDVARMYELVCFSRPDTSNIINFCSGIGTTVREMVNGLSDISGHTIEIREDKSLIRNGDLYDSVGDVSIIKSLGFSFDHSIKDTLLWLYEA